MEKYDDIQFIKNIRQFLSLLNEKSINIFYKPKFKLINSCVTLVMPDSICFRKCRKIQFRVKIRFVKIMAFNIEFTKQDLLSYGFIKQIIRYRKSSTFPKANI